MEKQECISNGGQDPLHTWCGCGTRIGEMVVTKCLACGKSTYGYKVRSADSPPRIYLVRECFACSGSDTPRITSACISPDSDFYWTKEKGASCCSNGSCSSAVGTNAQHASQLHTCTMLVELVEGCNMECPTCYAASPKTALEHSNPLPFEVFERNVLGRLEQQGKIDIIQLSGGEPTLHPEFFRIVAWLAVLVREGKIDDILLNTNGIKLLDQKFLRNLLAVIPIGSFSIYLQFDGLDADGQIELRGGDFRPVRERAIKAVTKHGIPVCLTMTVTHLNLASVWKTVEYALGNPMIKWVTLQPEFITGRNDKTKITEMPISVAHIVHSLADNSGGVITLKSFMPLPCSHPNCGSIGFLVKVEDTWHPVSKLVDLNDYTELIKDKMNFDIDQMVPAGCGCDDFKLDELLLKFGIMKDDIKMIFIKPFMDARTWDEERIQSCCTHVLLPDGSIDSFCRHYHNKATSILH